MGRKQKNVNVFAETLKFKAKLAGVDKEALAITGRMSISTLDNRYNDPDQFEIGELKRLSKKLRLTVVIENGEVKII